MFYEALKRTLIIILEIFAITKDLLKYPHIFYSRTDVYTLRITIVVTVNSDKLMNKEVA